MKDYRTLFNLEGKTAVVTGGIGILGQKFCAGLAAHGAQVAVVDLQESETQEFADQLSSRYKVDTVGICCDISSPGSIKDMAKQVSDTLGPIDILHNNAASKTNDISNFLKPVEKYDINTWREVMAVNLDGMFLVSQAIGPTMAERGQGSIINTASIYGVVAPDQSIYEGSEYLGTQINTPPVYSASKAGVLGLTQYLASYWGKQGVRVNTLTPGGVQSGQNETFKERYSQRVPLGRMAEADELVGALVYLASDASSYVTGQNIIVDGGLTAW